MPNSALILYATDNTDAVDSMPNSALILYATDNTAAVDSMYYGDWPALESHFISYCLWKFEIWLFYTNSIHLEITNFWYLSQKMGYGEKTSVFYGVKINCISSISFCRTNFKYFSIYN